LTGPPAESIQAFDVPPGRMHRLSSGEWIVGTSGPSTSLFGGHPKPGVYRFDTPLLRISNDGAHTDTIGEFPSTEVEISVDQGNTIMVPARFARMLSYVVSNDLLVIATADRFQLDLYDRTGRLVRSVRAPDVDVRLTREIEKDYRDFQSARLATASPAQRPAAERRFAQMKLPPTVPAYSSILVDADGNTWVGEYRYDLAPPQQFLIFNGDGQFTGRASVPAALRVMAVHGGRAWGLLRDELDVEYVVAYTLAKENPET